MIKTDLHDTGATQAGAIPQAARLERTGEHNFSLFDLKEALLPLSLDISFLLTYRR